MKIKKIKVNEIVGTAVTVLIAVLILFPLIWLLVSSFKSDADVIKWPPIFFPTQWLTAQYKYVVDAIPILSMLKNTVVFSVGVTVVSLFFDSMAAYAFSRMHFKGKNLIFGIILLTMMVPFQIIMIPLYIEEYKFKILDTYLGLILPRASSAYGIFMLTSFFENIPKSLDEAARIDGSGEFRTFNSIVLPIMKPAVAVQAIFTFVGSWNNYFVPALIIQSKSKMTVPILIATLRGADYMNFDMGKIYMMITVAIVPIIIVYLLLSKYIIAGVTLGGVKE